MTSPAISPTGVRFENVDKRYGALYALRRVSFEIAPAECVVFAGRNGSGKTTVLRVAAQLVRPSAGKVSFAAASSNGELTVFSAGFVSTNPETRMRSSFVAHATMVYDELSARENLLLFGRLQGAADPAKLAGRLLEEVGLADRSDSLVRTFSRGMRQRVAIARALLSNPAVLLLDEPATGLDPQGVAWLACTLRRLRDAGCTILMSLHGESELSSVATRGIRLDSGSVMGDTRTGVSLHSILAFAEG